MTQKRTLITGSQGFIGAALQCHLKTAGGSVCSLGRTARAGVQDSYAWDPANGRIDLACFQGVDQVVHLAGENIADGRWTAAKKARILQSRIQSTQLLCASLAELPQPPKVLLSASAVGFYGDRSDQWLSEESPAGSDFLANVCQAWEHHTEPARRVGIRCVILRIGVVLSPKGGALAKMLPPFRMGLGGRIGSGDQYVSWITLEDLISAMEFCLGNEKLSGPVNAVAPNPVTNRELTRALGAALKRPTILPLPSGLAKLLFGEMAEATLLASTRVEPAKLIAQGFRFASPDLATALQMLR